MHALKHVVAWQTFSVSYRGNCNRVHKRIEMGIARRSGDHIVLLDNAANAAVARQIGVGQGESERDFLCKLEMIANPVFKE